MAVLLVKGISKNERRIPISKRESLRIVSLSPDVQHKEKVSLTCGSREKKN